ncbi:Mitochondrial outer membrane protein iml2 [Elasticomyces elasticus]|nr:Mitochondrial outer membrane protein iml2 [Elasticomyces elasticus]
MREASERLATAESTASEHQRRAARDPKAYHSAIYPPGSEYGLCYAESQLMSAVVAVLNESLTESIKGFYKLRKAYATLNEISEAEKRYARSKSSTSVSSIPRQSIDSQRSTGSQRQMPGGFGVDAPRPQTPDGYSSRKAKLAAANMPSDEADGDDDDDFDFVDADEGLSGMPTPSHYLGHLDTGAESAMKGLSLGPSTQSNSASRTNLPDMAMQNDELDTVDFTHPIDEFIHSGTSLCFGILQLMLSLIPPAFSKLLYIIGFKGDRDAGIAMLWRATRYHNINGAMAGLVTLGYYNGMIGFCDILAADSYPKERCKILLGEMREKYPKSRLWLLEEARMRAGDGRLEDAVSMMQGAEKSPLKQVEALQWFENSLNCMYLHRFEDCAKSFLKCVELNNWSHSLYYYIAGACYVELYRLHKRNSPDKAKRYAVRAQELLFTVPQHAGKKRFMARQLPFDVFVTRKISKWQHRASEWGISFIDAIGVSPIEEMIYFWNGYKRMRAEQLEDSLARLAWSESAENTTWAREGLDEQSVLWVLKAATLRNLKRTREAKTILRTRIINHEWPEFKGHLKDNWCLPVAHYEMAVNLWIECGGEAGSSEQLMECSEWLEKVAKWESYEMDARIGLKITTARDSLRKCGVTAP